MPRVDTLATLTLSDFGLDPTSRTARLRRVGDAILAAWSGQASQELNRTLGAYKRALQVRVLDEHTVRVSLPGDEAAANAHKVAQLARLVEFGMGPGGIGTEGPYDVRHHILKSGTRSLRYDKQGRPYLNVPFDHTGKSIEMMGGLRALGQAQRLEWTRSIQSNAGAWRTLWGGRLPAGLAPKLKEHHTTDPLAGMVRQGSTYSGGQTKASGYRTWRRASWGAPSPKWMSSGVRAHRIGDKIAARLSEIVMGVL
jgi:hypothetical protein